MRIGSHKHPCDHCHTPTDCDGDTQENYDGFPEWICLDYHVISRSEFLCDACGEKAEAAYQADMAENV
jgi:hypothetical protein